LNLRRQEGAVWIQHHILAKLGARVLEIGLRRVDVGLGSRGCRLRFLQIDRRQRPDLHANQVLPHQVQIEFQRGARHLQVFFGEHDVPVIAADPLHEILQRLPIIPLRLLLSRLGNLHIDSCELPSEVLQQGL